MSEILSREVFDATKPRDELTSQVDIETWANRARAYALTIEALSEALNVLQKTSNEHLVPADAEDSLNTLREKGWLS